jgi:hypothetical protein
MLANYKITFTAALAAFAIAPPLTAQTSVTHFPALRSDPMALSGASRRKQIPGT